MRCSKNSHFSYLSGRDRQILAHVARYRLTTPRTLQREVLQHVSLNAVGKIANRLCRTDLLAKYPLVHPAKYFVLGRGGARVMGIGAHRVVPLGPQSLPTEYAVLLHAVLGKKKRVRLTNRELLDHWPWLPPKLAMAPHCLDVEQQVIELVRVDLGGTADHVARRAIRDITVRRRLPEFLSVVSQQRFRLVLITATRGKAAVIRAAIEHHDVPTGLQLHSSVVSQLLNFTRKQSHA